MRIIKLKIIGITLLTLISLCPASYAQKEIYLSNTKNINITYELSKDQKALKQLIESKYPKALYLEQWTIADMKDEPNLKKIYKIAKKYKVKLYLVIGKNTWFGKRGVSNTLSALNRYQKHIDGIVLRTEPNKVNVWKDDLSIKAQILNQMLDAYSAIYIETKKRNKSFIAEFPFWYSDFNGPQKTFSQNACDYSDRVIFLIDDVHKLDELDIKWNDVSCPYNINLTKRALNQTEETLRSTYQKLQKKLTFYANFNGYLVDSDTVLEN